MSPHELTTLDPAHLSEVLCAALNGYSIDSARDAFLQIESRFQGLAKTAEGNREFLDAFLPLSGRPEVRSLHLEDALAQCVARLEYLLELAGEGAGAVTDEAILRQIVDSRERGFDLLHALASAPEHGLAAGDLAERLGITPQNLSPLITMFHAQGIVNRSKQGKNAFITLTEAGRALVTDPEPAPRQEPEYMFFRQQRPMKGFAGLFEDAA
jgi:hypothetical protein